MDATTQSIMDMAQRLIRFRTTPRHLDEIETCMEYIASEFDDRFHVEEYVFDGKPCLVISFTDTKNPAVMLNGHIDVVPGPEHVFQPHVEDGKLYGRGAADMKTGVATFIRLLKDFAAKDVEPDIAVALVADEETTGNGTEQLLAEAGYRPQFMIAGEPNHSRNGSLNICVEQKGILKLRVEATGAAAHSSRPWKGANAITQVMEAYRDLADYFAETTPANRWQTTATPVRIEGGDALNQVPAAAELYLDIRFTPDTDTDALINELRERTTAAISVVNISPAVRTEEGNQYIQALETVASTYYDTVSLERTHGASDLCFLAPYNIPGVECGPTGRNLHSDDEHVYLDSITPYYETLKQFIEHAAT